jgi:hypothetical protein
MSADRSTEHDSRAITSCIERSSRQAHRSLGHQDYAPVYKPSASVQKLTDQRGLTLLETRSAANIGPHDPFRADRALRSKVTRPASHSVLETRSPANTSPLPRSEPRRRHNDCLLHGHQPLLQRPQERRHPQQLRLDLAELRVPPSPFSRRRPRPPRLRRDLGVYPRRELRDGVGGLVPTDPQLRRPRTASTRAASSAVSMPRTRRSSLTVAGVAGVVGGTTSTPAVALDSANKYSRRLLSVCARARQLAEQNRVSRRFAMNGLPHSSFSHGLTTVISFPRRPHNPQRLPTQTTFLQN